VAAPMPEKPEAAGRQGVWVEKHGNQWHRFQPNTGRPRRRGRQRWMGRQEAPKKQRCGQEAIYAAPLMPQRSSA
jgi:hypothetical protein